MQITFDPLNEKEAAYVRNVLGGKIMHTVTVPIVGTGGGAAGSFAESPATVRAEVAATIAQADQPDTGAIPRSELTGEQLRAAYEAPIGASAAPLEQPAPLPAAADLFGTAPVAPPAGEANAPTVPSPPVPTAPPVAPAPSANALPVLPADAVDKHGLPWDERIHSGTRVKNADGSWRQRRGVDPENVKTVENELRALMALPTRPGITLGSAGPLDMTPTDAKDATAPAAPTPEGPAANATALAAIPAPGNGSMLVPPPVPAAPLVPAPANSSSTTAVAPVSAPTAMAAAGPTEGNVPPPPVPAPPTSAPATAPIPSPPVPLAPTAAEPAAPLTFATMLRKVTDALAQNKIKETDVHAALEQIGLLPTQIGLLSARADLLPTFDMHIAAAIGAGHA